MTNDDLSPKSPAATDATSGAPPRDIPIDWEALEDAFENNAPEVHSYLHLATGDVLRVVDGVADPQMHARINGDAAYLRIAPVSSREQYRWMERFIPMVDEPDLRGKLAASIDGKGAFRRFKDVLMSHSVEREKWFAFRSERLRTFMEAWLVAHALHPVPRPSFPAEDEVEEAQPSEEAASSPAQAPPSTSEGRERRGKNPDAVRKHVKDIIEALGPRDLDTLAAFAEFLKARRIARTFAHHHEQHHGESGSDEPPVSSEVGGAAEKPERSPATMPGAEIRPTGSEE